MVQYQIQFKPINPVNNSPITNQKIFRGATSNTSSEDYDCMLMFIKTNFPTQGTDVGKIYPSELMNVPHDVWCIYAIADSVKQAIIISKPLMQEYGVSNVQIVKVVPASTEIVFEENNG